MCASANKGMLLRQVQCDSRNAQMQLPNARGSQMQSQQPATRMTCQAGQLVRRSPAALRVAATAAAAPTADETTLNVADVAGEHSCKRIWDSCWLHECC